ncbi:polysaccharide biosynthesis tyrosine autokinase [Phenylobacterium sp.]|uniref:GumC family protein n=1 Tax=Phenylobacterium sp. TaxID=1871053 RepID=UPI0027351C0C|nr:polysaccharide biosynthesis tyrosine autokinase [Phenylobacterium sp.]
MNFAPLPSTSADLSFREKFAALGFDPLQLLAFIRRRLELLLAVSVLVFVAALLYAMQLTPRYTATTDVLIDTRQKPMVSSEQIMSGFPADSSAVDTEVRILTSRSLAERVVRKLNLQLDPEFNPTLNAKPGLLTRLGLKKAAPTQRRSTAAGIEAAVATVQNGMSVQRAGLTYIITISYTSTDAATASRLANAIGDLYITDQLEAKYNAARVVSDWLAGRMTGLRQEVELADARVQQYKIANNLMSAQGATMAEQEVSTLNQQLAAARADRAEKMARLQAARTQIQRGGGGADVGAALGSSTISSLRSQEADTSRQLADLNARYGPAHPDVIKANGALADIQQQINSEIRRIISSLEAEVSVSSQRLASLEGSQGSARGSLVSNSRAQVGLLELERKAEASRAIYESFLNRSKETSSQEGIQQPDARVISYSTVPRTPSYPNMRLVIAFGAALALVCGLAAIIAAELLDSGLSTGDDVESRLGLPYAASLPKLSPTDLRAGQSPQDFLVDNPFSVFAEAFRSLRAFLLLGAADGAPAPSMIAICSALPHEGKTITSFCLMRTLAMSGSSVVLVDADLRRRAVSKLVEAPAIGLLEAIEDPSRLDQAMVKDTRSEAMILPVVGDVPSSGDLFGSSDMDVFLAALRKRFDYVLIDTPPVLALAETRLIATKVDQVVFLAKWRQTPAKAAQNAIATLIKSGARVAGVCLTQVDLRRQSSEGYGDSAYYYRAYKDYYTS